MTVHEEFFELARYGYAGTMTFFNSADPQLNNANREARVEQLEFVPHAQHWVARLHIVGPRPVQEYEFDDVLLLQSGTDTFISRRVNAYADLPDSETQITIRCDGIEPVVHRGREKLLVVGEWTDRKPNGSWSFHGLLDRYDLPRPSRLTEEEIESLMRFKVAKV